MGASVCTKRRRIISIYLYFRYFLSCLLDLSFWGVGPIRHPNVVFEPCQHNLAHPGAVTNFFVVSGGQESLAYEIRERTTVATYYDRYSRIRVLHVLGQTVEDHFLEEECRWYLLVCYGSGLGAIFQRSPHPMQDRLRIPTRLLLTSKHQLTRGFKRNRRIKVFRHGGVKRIRRILAINHSRHSL